MKLYLSCLSLLILTTLAAHADWTTDYKAALDQAATEKKLVLLNFTDSDGCSSCKLLDQQVFSSQEFKDFADKNYILVTVDLSIRKESPEDLEQHEQLRHKYRAPGFPTLVVINPDGKVRGRVSGYHTNSGADAVIAELQSINSSSVYMDPRVFLTPQELQRLQADEEAVLQDNPQLTEQANAVNQQLQALIHNPNATPEDRKAYREQFRESQEAMDRALLQMDPGIEPVLDKVEDHIRAKHPISQ